MRVLQCHMIQTELSGWQTMAPTQTTRNSTLHSSQHHGWIRSMWPLGQFPITCWYSKDSTLWLSTVGWWKGAVFWSSWEMSKHTTNDPRIFAKYPIVASCHQFNDYFPFSLKYSPFWKKKSNINIYMYCTLIKQLQGYLTFLQLPHTHWGTLMKSSCHTQCMNLSALQQSQTLPEYKR